MQHRPAEGATYQDSLDPASTRPGGERDLYAMNPDGSAVTRLTHATSEDQEPAFCTGACP